MEKLDQIYDREFYDGQTRGSSLAAKAILKILYKFYTPLSVIDIGCGRGSWLAVAESLGSKYIRGIDGHWINNNDLLSKNIDFTPIDLEKPIQIKERYDLCISIEVAEHLSKNRANGFIETLCNVSDVVLFSAAIKFQEGANHINKQWQSYWIKIFDSFDYGCFDIFRYVVWEDEALEWWFRQNIFLFVNQSSSPISFNRLKAAEKPIPDIVHPKNYEDKIEAYTNVLNEPTLDFCLTCLKNYFYNKMMKSFSNKGRKCIND